MEEQGSEENTERAEPELLYHYTTENGLNGILKKGKIWATHYRFLNDISECAEALCLVDQIIEQKQSQFDSFGDQLEASRKIRNAADDRARKNINRLLDSVDVYLTSLTDDSRCPSPGDRLSQWRGYGQNSRVFSLELRRDRLKSQTQEFGKGNQIPIELWECLYGENDESRTKRKVITWAFGAIAFTNSFKTRFNPGRTWKRTCFNGQRDSRTKASSKNANGDWFCMFPLERET